MPVVKTETAYLLGKQFKKVYNVDKSGKFWMTIPEELATVLCIDRRITADKLADLDPKLNKLVAEYKASNTMTRKVIVYRFASTATIYDGHDPEHEDTPECTDEENHRMAVMGNVLFRSQQISFTSGEALSLAVAVFDEHVTKLAGGNVAKRYTYCRSSIPYGAFDDDIARGGKEEDDADDVNYMRYADCTVRMLAWTEKREAFFASLVHAIEGLIMKLADLTSTKKSILSLADRGSVKLLE